MGDNERTRDIYEEINGYPKPLLVPLPEADDLESLEKLGIQPGSGAYRLAKAVLFATGYKSFHRQLPATIEGLLRRYNTRGANLFTPVISATLALTNDPRKIDPVERAATLVFAAYSLYNDIFTGRFSPDTFRGQVLEMGQYPNFFSTSLIMDGNRPRIFKSTNTTRIIVAVARRLYSLTVGQPGTGTTIEQLIEALAGLVDNAHQNRTKVCELSPGILTCATHVTQFKFLQKLQKIDANADSFNALRHSFLTLCLDLDSYPASDAEAAFFAHSTNCGNRWYHSSLQLVVFGNARACVICNFNTYVDGNPMMRMASELQKRAATCQVAKTTKPEAASLPPANVLKWQVSHEIMLRAQRELRLIQDNQQATFELPGIGKTFFAKYQVDPVPVFILALQMTAKRLIGKIAGIEQFLTMSKYRCMDLVSANVTTPEVASFVEYMEGENIQPDQALVLLQDAVASQARACRQERKYLPLDTILNLFVRSSKGFRRIYISSLLLLVIGYLRRSGLMKAKQREIIVSHPEIYPEVPVVGRPGVRLPYTKYFGLHYQILAEKIVITMMPSVTWTIPNAELIAVLQESLRRIQGVLPGRQDNFTAR